MAAGPEDHPDVQVFDEIRYIEHLVRTTITHKLPVGLTYPQFEVMNLLSRRGDGISPLDVARALQMTKSGLTNTLQRLEAQGFVLITDDPADGRRKIVSLTLAGAAAQAAGLAATRPQLDALREAFEAGEFAGVLPFLDRLRGWLDHNRPA